METNSKASKILIALLCVVLVAGLVFLGYTGYKVLAPQSTGSGNAAIDSSGGTNENAESGQGAVVNSGLSDLIYTPSNLAASGSDPDLLSTLNNHANVTAYCSGSEIIVEVSSVNRAATGYILRLEGSNEYRSFTGQMTAVNLKNSLKSIFVDANLNNDTYKVYYCLTSTASNVRTSDEKMFEFDYRNHVAVNQSLAEYQSFAKGKDGGYTELKIKFTNTTADYYQYEYTVWYSLGSSASGSTFARIGKFITEPNTQGELIVRDYDKNIAADTNIRIVNKKVTSYGIVVEDSRDVAAFKNDAEKTDYGLILKYEDQYKIYNYSGKDLNDTDVENPTPAEGDYGAKAVNAQRIRWGGDKLIMQVYNNTNSRVKIQVDVKFDFGLTVGVAKNHFKTYIVVPPKWKGEVEILDEAYVATFQQAKSCTIVSENYGYEVTDSGSFSPENYTDGDYKIIYKK